MSTEKITILTNISLILEELSTLSENNLRERTDFIKYAIARLENSYQGSSQVKISPVVVFNNNIRNQKRNIHSKTELRLDLPVLKIKISLFFKTKSIVFDLPEILGILDAMITKLESKES